MDFIITAISWLALSWLFIPLVAISLLATYFNVKNDRDDFPIFSGFLVAGIVYLSSFRFESLSVLFSWSNIGYFLGGYILIGFFVALFKWILKLKEFKRVALEKRTDLEESLEKDVLSYLDKNPRSNREDAIKSVVDGNRNRLVSTLSYKYNLVCVDSVTGKIYLGVEKSLVSKHWIYWPFFILTVVLDPITEFVNFMVDYLKNLFTIISKRFSV